MNTEQLKDAIATYLETSETEYAIMINGEWGSGKTYFWKETIESELENFNLISIYVSLYGLTSVEEIEQKIIYSLLNLSGKNTKNKYDLSPLLSEAPKYIFNIYNWLNEENKIDFKGTSFKPLVDLGSTFVKDFILNNTLFKCSEQYVFCFDDLERVDINRSNIFGYINKFVEHHHIKTVLISNEDQFCKEDEKEREYYKITKEKLVGYTFNIKPSFEDTIDQFIEGYDDSFKQIIRKHKALIIRLVEANGNKNLRIVKNCLSISNHIFQELNKIEYSITTINEELIRFIFAVNLEVKTGKADLDELFKLCTEGHQPFANIQSPRRNYRQYNSNKDITIETPKEESEEKKEYSEKFIHSYYIDFDGSHYDCSISYTKFTSIYNYIVKGYFDENKFKEEINERQNLENTPKLKLFNNYFELSNDEFEQVIKEYIDELKQDRINTLSNLIKLTEYLFYFASIKLIKKTKEQIKDIFKNTIKRQYKNNKLFYLNENIGNDYSILPEIEKKDKNYKYIIRFSKRVNKLLAKKQRYNNASQLIDLLEEGWQKFWDEICIGYQIKPIFAYLDVNKFASVLIKLENPVIVRFTRWIKNRYKTSNIKDFLSIEYQNLKQLNDLLKNYVEEHSNNKKLNHHLITELYEEIDRACEKLK
ncbi:KAP P-loop domain protein [Stanieria sp. NIES-3757]|nr:KAP P-loop domain protein [Stanieria sp. NIES-3757]